MESNELTGNHEQPNQVGQTWPLMIDSSGRVIIPADARKAGGWANGTRLILEKGVDGVFHIMTLDAFVQMVQEHFQQVFGERSLVDELLDERKVEVDIEESGN